MTGPDGMPVAEPVLMFAVTCYVEASDAAEALTVAVDMLTEQGGAGMQAAVAVDMLAVPGGAGMLAAVGVIKVRRARPGESVLG